MYITVKYYNKSLAKWLDKLDKRQRFVALNLISLLEQKGDDPLLPQSKNLKKGLRELRDKNFGLRIYYTFYEDELIIVLASGNKSSQKKDIKRARDRLNRLKKTT